MTGMTLVTFTPNLRHAIVRDLQDTETDAEPKSRGTETQAHQG
jgi:hypothetical protein